MIRVKLNRVEAFPFKSADELMEYVDKHKGILVAVNAEKILHSTPETEHIINGNIGYCDGVGAVKAMHQKRHNDVTKIAGCELWLKIIAKYSSTKSFYLIGGKQEVIDETVAKLKKEFSAINIVGYRNGYITSDEERAQLIADVAHLKPEVVFVAMGSPKQELLMGDMLKVNPAIYQGLGGSFDVYTGHVNRAPRWWVDHNLEFAYRLIKEPSRIKRQIHLVKFFWWLIIGKFK
ncbi:MAG TPA: glycosyltransferase [Lachnospiraceae bacterium]|nr:glycosyltransferase [Lachnospiraceae bacterium]